MKKEGSEILGQADRARLDTGRGGKQGISLRNLRTFSSFKNPVYRLYFFGMTWQWAAMNMEQMVRSLLIYRLTGSAAILGVMALANALPMLFLSLFGGVIADRVQKKYILLAGFAGSAAVVFGVALALRVGYLSTQNPGSWWILIATSILHGMIMGLMMPSRQVIILEIVGEKQLMNAIALNHLGMNSLRLLAPALAGFLIDATSFTVVYYVMTAMYLVAILFITLMPRTGTITIGSTGALADMREAFQYVRHNTVILIILAFTLFGQMLSQPYMQLLPIFTEDILKVGASGLGILMGVSGMGATFGALVIASLPNRKRGFILLLSSFVMGLALVGFAFSYSWYLSLTLIVFVGLGQSGRLTLGNTLLQSYAEERYRARVMSFYMMEHGFTSLAAFAAGLTAEMIGAQWSIGSFAMALALLSISALIFVPRLRKLD